MEPIARLQASIDQTRLVVTATTADQLDQPSNCAEWDVRALANHLVGVLEMFRQVASNGAADMSTFDADHVGDGFAGAYDRMAVATVAAWSAGDLAVGTANMPWGEMPAQIALQMLADDILVHGWDLSRSTGQSVTWDQDLAAETFGFAQGFFVSPEIREGSFGAPVPVDESADAMTKLVAFLGRQP